VWYECSVHDPDDGSTLDAWGRMPLMQTPMAWSYEGSPGDLGWRTDTLHVGWVAPAHCAVAARGGKEFDLHMDAYRGPVDPSVRKSLLAAGWKSKEPLLDFPKDLSTAGRTKKADATFRLADALVRLRKSHARSDGAKAREYAQSFESHPVADDISITLRVEIVGVNPKIWRTVRVPANLSLSRLHDQVLSPVFGYSRNYHAHAFRRAVGEPWLGAPDSTAMDMKHVTWYIKALGNDKVSSALVSRRA